MATDPQIDVGSGNRKSISRKIQRVRRKVMKAFRKTSTKVKEVTAAQTEPIEDLDLGEILSLPIEIDNDSCPAVLLLRSSSAFSRNETNEENSITIDPVRVEGKQGDSKSVATEASMTDDSSTEEIFQNCFQKQGIPPGKNSGDLRSAQIREGQQGEPPFWHRFMCGSIALPTANCDDSFKLSEIDKFKAAVQFDLLASSCSKLKDPGSHVRGGPIDDPESKDVVLKAGKMAGKASLGYWLGSPLDRQSSDASSQDPDDEKIERNPLSRFFVRKQQPEQTDRESEGKNENTILDPVELAKRQWHSKYLRLSVQRLLQQQGGSEDEDNETPTALQAETPPQEIIHLRHVPLFEQKATFDGIEKFTTTQGSLDDEVEDSVHTKREKEPGGVKDLHHETEPEVESGKESWDWKDELFGGEIEDSHFQSAFFNRGSTTTNVQAKRVPKTSTNHSHTTSSIDSSDIASQKYLVKEETAGSDGNKDDVSVGTIVRELAELQDLQKPLRMAVAEAKINHPPPLPPSGSQNVSTPTSSQHVFASTHLTPASPLNQQQVMKLEENQRDRYEVQEDTSVGRYTVEEETSVFVDPSPNGEIRPFASFAEDPSGSRKLAGEDTSPRQSEKGCSLTTVESYHGNDMGPPDTQIQCLASRDHAEVKENSFRSTISVRSIASNSRDSAHSGASGIEEDYSKASNRSYRRLQSADSVDLPEDDSLFEESESEDTMPPTMAGPPRKQKDSKYDLKRPCEEIIVNDRSVHGPKETLSKKVAFDLDEEIASSAVSSQTNYTIKQDLLYSCVGETVTNAFMQEMGKYMTEEYADASESDEGSGYDGYFFEKLTDDDDDDSALSSKT